MCSGEATSVWNAPPPTQPIPLQTFNPIPPPPPLQLLAMPTDPARAAYTTRLRNEIAAGRPQVWMPPGANVNNPISLGIGPISDERANEVFARNPMVFPTRASTTFTPRLLRDEPLPMKIDTKQNVEKVNLQMNQPGNMTLSAAGVDYLIRRETPHQERYLIRDEQGRITHVRLHYMFDGGMTAGFGYFMPHGSPEIQNFQTPLSVAEARTLFEQRIQRDVDAINDWLIENNITVTQNQFDALVSIRYNMGNIGMLLPILRSGTFDRDDMTEAMMSTSRANMSPVNFRINEAGLLNRRNDEMEMFFNNNYDVGPQILFNFD